MMHSHTSCIIRFFSSVCFRVSSNYLHVMMHSQATLAAFVWQFYGWCFWVQLQSASIRGCNVTQIALVWFDGGNMLGKPWTEGYNTLITVIINHNENNHLWENGVTLGPERPHHHISIGRLLSGNNLNCLNRFALIWAKIVWKVSIIRWSSCQLIEH